jgi:hypothetical protein
MANLNLFFSLGDGSRSSFRNSVFTRYLEFRTMGKVQKPNDSERYTPPSEPFRFYIKRFTIIINYYYYYYYYYYYTISKLLPWTKATPSVIVVNTRQILTQEKGVSFLKHTKARAGKVYYVIRRLGTNSEQRGNIIVCVMRLLLFTSKLANQISRRSGSPCGHIIRISFPICSTGCHPSTHPPVASNTTSRSKHYKFLVRAETKFHCSGNVYQFFVVAVMCFQIEGCFVFPNGDGIAQSV